MIRCSLALLFTVSALCTAPATAQERPVQVEAFSISETGRLGTAMWRQDVAAARATDALVSASGGQAPQGLIGWIVTAERGGQRVRFLSGETSEPQAFKDVLVDDRFRAGPVIDVAEPTLSADEIAQFRARNTAAQAIGPLRCSANYNAVMIKKSDESGWLVWLLAATTQANIVPMGGHYRFHISADGQTVEKREQLSSSCLDMDRSQGQQGSQTVGLVTSIVVAPRPLEIHAYLSLLNRVPIYALAGDKIWEVQGARIVEIASPSRR